MSICDKCKRNYVSSNKNDDFKCIRTGSYIDNPPERCSGYIPRKLTNRDMLEKKIHEMSDAELAELFEDCNDITGKKINSIIGKNPYLQTFGCILNHLSQPCEEKKYVVYRKCKIKATNSYEGKLYYSDNKNANTINDTTSAWKGTLQQANEKRNELNKQEPLDNWQVEEM